MSAPIVWIVFPILVSVFSFFFRRKKILVWITLSLISFVLTLIAWFLPIGELVNMGPVDRNYS